MTRLLALTFAVSLLGTPQIPAEQREGLLIGVARSATSGEPLKSVVVSLRLLSDRHRSTKTTTTGPEGGFAFRGLAAGQYELTFRKTGYRTLDGRQTRFIVDEKRQLDKLVFSLWPMGAVSGRVQDAEREPVPEAGVRAYRLLHSQADVTLAFAGRAKADDLGEYRLYDLRAGKYLLLVSPPGPATPVGEFYAHSRAAFYPGASAPSQALPLIVNWGQELTGVDLALSGEPSFAVAGSLWDATTGQPCIDCVVRAVRLDAGILVRLPNSARASQRGLFALRGLSRGDYKLIARRSGADEVVSQTSVTITDRDVEGVALVVGRTQAVSGEVVLDDPPEGVDPSAWTAYLSSGALPQSWPDSESGVNEEARFLFQEVPAETYSFELLDLPPGAYLKALRVGGQSLPRPEIIVTPDAPLTSVQAVIGFDAATVSGQVRRRRPADNEGPIQGQVWLVPRANQSGYLAPKSVETASDGSFVFTSVVPGSYTLYALPATSSAQIFDPVVQSALRSQAQQINPEPHESAAAELVLAPNPSALY